MHILYVCKIETDLFGGSFLEAQVNETARNICPCLMVRVHEDNKRALVAQQIKPEMSIIVV